MKANASVSDQLWSLANGSKVLVKRYSGCIINGVIFHSRDLDNRRRSQNSGVLVEGEHGDYFFGHLCNVWEFEYICENKVVLFECEWYDTSITGRKTIRADPHCTSIDVTTRWYKDDPFILPSQAKQVFYVNDTKEGERWKVVQWVEQRGVYDLPEAAVVENEDLPESNDAFQLDETNGFVPIVVNEVDVQ